MIHFFYEEVSPIQEEDKRALWIENLIREEGKIPGKISYILCNDAYLLEINQKYLQHDFYTDIVTFDYCKGHTVSGDIFLSLQRVFDNADSLKTNKEDELNRVLAHGILHMCGYNDKTEEQRKTMRRMEEYYMKKY